MHRPLRVALVGAGYTAKEHARAFADVPGVGLVGIHSRTRGRADALAQEAKIPLVCDSVDELYERTQADLVVVTVVELAMNAIAKACCRHPWKLLLEKPPGYDLDDALDIAAAAKAQSREVYVALNRRSLSATLAVRDQLATVDGARFIKVQDQQSQARALAAGQPPKVVENWMFANSIHVIDYFRQLGRGDVVEVTPVLPWRPSEPGVVVTKLAFSSGDVGLYEGIWHAPGPWAVSVTVPQRRWEIRPLEEAVTQKLGEPAQKLPGHAHDTSFKPGFRLQAEWAAQAVRGARSEAGALATLDDAIETMRLIGRMFPR